MIYKEITEIIIGCAYRVYNKLGSGFVEPVYRESLLIELRKAGLRCSSEEPIYVRYDDQVVGKYFADIVVEEKIILELKAVSALSRIHEVQLVNYLAATGISVGLLMNFGEEKVVIRRKLRDLKDLCF